MCSVAGALVGGLFGKKALKTPKVETTTANTAIAQPAAAVDAPDAKTETGVDTTGETLKRKARGKKGLMINPTNTGGGSSGTGLNI